jgi:peptide/nickel transport system substrate-binding protein
MCQASGLEQDGEDPGSGRAHKIRGKHLSRAARIRRPGGRVGWALLAGAVVLAGCGGNGGGNDGGAADTTTTTEQLGEPIEGGTLTIGLEAESTSWLPSQAQWAAGGYAVAHAIYDPLMQRDEDGELQPYLAESVEPNDDLSEWTVTLRPGITFHDGTDLTADVMKAIFDEYLTVPPSVLTGVLEGVSMEVVDELTFTYVLPEPNSAFPDVLQYTAGMPFSIEAAREAGDDAGSNPVGTGAFVFESWTTDDRLVVTKNEDYWREGLPYLDRITFRPIPDEESRVSSLFAGEVDAIQSLRGANIKQVIDAEDSGFVAHLFLGNTSGASIMNTLEPPFDDVRVRRAFAMASDPEDVAAVLGDDGLVDETTQFFSTDSPWWSQRVADAYPGHDPEGAREVLQEYIDDPDRSDGQPVGTPPRFVYNCLPDASLIEVAQLIQQDANAVGFRVDLRQVEQATHIANAIGGADTDPPYRGDYVVNCWRIGGEDDPYFTLAEGPTSFGEGNPQANFTNFSDPRLTQLFEDLRTTAEFEDRYEIVEEIGILINENVPISFGVGTPMMVGVKDSVKNVRGWTLPDGTTGNGIPGAVPRLREVWIED